MSSGFIFADFTLKCKTEKSNWNFQRLYMQIVLLLFVPTHFVINVCRILKLSVALCNKVFQ